MLARRTESLASTHGGIGGLYVATNALVRSEFRKDGWVPCGGKAQFSRWFLAGVVSPSARSVGSILLGWVKSSVGWVIASISSSAN